VTPDGNTLLVCRGSDADGGCVTEWRSEFAVPPVAAFLPHLAGKYPFTKLSYCQLLIQRFSRRFMYLAGHGK
jgi:hypothetical protein